MVRIVDRRSMTNFRTNVAQRPSPLQGITTDEAASALSTFRVRRVALQGEMIHHQTVLISSYRVVILTDKCLRIKMRVDRLSQF